MTLREFLQQIGMSQAEAARRLGYSPGHVNRLCQGTVRLTPGTRIRVAYLGIKPEALEEPKDQTHDSA